MLDVNKIKNNEIKNHEQIGKLRYDFIRVLRLQKCNYLPLFVHSKNEY